MNMPGGFDCLGIEDITDVCKENPCPENHTCQKSLDGKSYTCVNTINPCDSVTCDGGFICIITVANRIVVLLHLLLLNFG